MEEGTAVSQVRNRGCRPIWRGRPAFDATPHVDT